MLPKKFRLKKYSAINATYKLKNTVSDTNICIYFGKEKILQNQMPTKIAFVVSKKIHKRAVVRNRIKRLMRESLRLILKENKFPIINNYISVIFVAKASAINSDFTTINSSVIKLLSSKS